MSMCQGEIPYEAKTAIFCPSFLVLKSEYVSEIQTAALASQLYKFRWLALLPCSCSPAMPLFRCWPCCSRPLCLQRLRTLPGETVVFRIPRALIQSRRACWGFQLEGICRIAASSMTLVDQLQWSEWIVT